MWKIKTREIKCSHSDGSNSLRLHGLQPIRLLCPQGFSGQEYWSGLLFASLGDLPDPGIEPGSPSLQPLSSPSLHEMFPCISNSLEDIPSLSHSVVFLYFFALITEEGFLISSCYYLELCIQMLNFPFLLCLSLLFSAICHFAFLHFLFLAIVLTTAFFTMLRTSIHSSSDTLLFLIP